MIYLRTGSNGSCKTLFTLHDVRKLQLETGRPVCINGRFKMREAKRLEFGWNVIDFKDWQSEPDGTIFLIDECHNDLPLRANSATVPEPVRMLAEHRARGFDFFLLTQHPMNIDAFVRKLIGAPGWHQHLKRVFGGTNTTRVLQWDAVNPQCEKDGSGKTAQIVNRTQPKEVYEWYESASLHTAKVRIPKQVYVLAACAVAIPALFWYGFQHLPKGAAQAVNRAQPIGPSSPLNGPQRLTEIPKGEMTAADLLASYVPRIAGFPQTAPRYDEVTKPTTAPYPAACVSMGSRCDCYSQQGTKIQTPPDVCKQIVAGGFFQDWALPVPTGGALPAPAQNNAPAVQPGPMPGSLVESRPVGVGESKQVAQNSGDHEALGSMRIGKRLVN